MPSFGPNPGGIKSIQRGVISLNGVGSNTATITSVVTAKSELRFLGATSGGVAATDCTCSVVLTGATTITAARTGTSNLAVVSWELTEWY